MGGGGNTCWCWVMRRLSCRVCSGGREVWRAAVLIYLARALVHSQRHEKSDRLAGHCHSFGSPGARANCSEYFPIFMSLLWVAGIFFHQGVAAACGLMYLYKRFKYFQGYSVAAQGRLGPLYASALLLWLLLGLAVAGLLAHFLLSRSSAWTTVLVWPRQLLGAW
ncbi:leukotriene C4 synthase isoform X1 [Falco cherrug]|uniref:leukotriene C4 synthase isoform X1 n=1 Tax=Falco cherrug TaxID=345164 RepID=UPI002478D11A|nr:leukotriene C4 synthase isoform X1 [Falco cherrug]